MSRKKVGGGVELTSSQNSQQAQTNQKTTVAAKEQGERVINLSMNNGKKTFDFGADTIIENFNKTAEAAIKNSEKRQRDLFFMMTNK